MIYSFSQSSRDKLEGVDARLQDLAFRIIGYIDCKILSGVRTEAEQLALVAEGKSRTMNSRHLVGKALDIAPYPIDWNDTNRFYYFAGIVLGISYEMDIPIRWGGDWDRDNDIHDQTFNDLLHFEIPKEDDTT